jgi:hypothetical protein
VEWNFDNNRLPTVNLRSVWKLRDIERDDVPIGGAATMKFEDWNNLVAKQAGCFESGFVGSPEGHLNETRNSLDQRVAASATSRDAATANDEELSVDFSGRWFEVGVLEADLGAGAAALNKIAIRFSR